MLISAHFHIPITPHDMQWNLYKTIAEFYGLMAGIINMILNATSKYQNLFIFSETALQRNYYRLDIQNSVSFVIVRFWINIEIDCYLWNNLYVFWYKCTLVPCLSLSSSLRSTTALLHISTECLLSVVNELVNVFVPFLPTVVEHQHIVYSSVLTGVPNNTLDIVSLCGIFTQDSCPYAFSVVVIRQILSYLPLKMVLITTLVNTDCYFRLE